MSTVQRSVYYWRRSWKLRLLYFLWRYNVSIWGHMTVSTNQNQATNVTSVSSPSSSQVWARRAPTCKNTSVSSPSSSQVWARRALTYKNMNKCELAEQLTGLSSASTHLQKFTNFTLLSPLKRLEKRSLFLKGWPNGLLQVAWPILALRYLLFIL